MVSGGLEPPRYERAFSDTTQNLPLASMANVDAAWRKGITEIGVLNKEAIIVSFPDKPSEPIELCTDMHNGSWRYVYLDQHTLQELPASQPQIAELDVAQWLRRTNYAWHVGAIGGLPTKILFFLASLICTSLPITGFYIWWNKKAKTKKRSKALSPHSSLSVSTGKA